MRFVLLILVILFLMRNINAMSNRENKVERSEVAGYGVPREELTPEQRQAEFEADYHRVTGGQMFAVCKWYAEEDEICLPVADGTIMKCACRKIDPESEARTPEFAHG